MKQNKQTVKLNESKLRDLIKESIKKILNEEYNGNDGRWREIVEEIHRLATELNEIANSEEFQIASGKFDLTEAAEKILAITGSLGGGLNLSSMVNEEEFTPHGYSSISNWGGHEIQLSDTGEMARIRTVGGAEPSKPTRWLKIYFTNEGVAYIMFKGRRVRLDQFMKY